MTKAANCYFVITYGLQGCYMPDSDTGAYCVNRRKDLINAVRDALAMYEAPKRRINDVNWKRLWSQAKERGTSSIHFCIAVDKHNMIEFHGLTEAEYNERMSQDDC